MKRNRFLLLYTLLMLSKILAAQIDKVNNEDSVVAVLPDTLFINEDGMLLIKQDIKDTILFYELVPAISPSIYDEGFSLIVIDLDSGTSYIYINGTITTYIYIDKKGIIRKISNSIIGIPYHYGVSLDSVGNLNSVQLTNRSLNLQNYLDFQDSFFVYGNVDTFSSINDPLLILGISVQANEFDPVKSLVIYVFDKNGELKEVVKKKIVK